MASNKFVQTENSIRRISQKTDTVLLFYSAGGKDSIALLDMIAPKFKKVVCVFGYTIPDADHVRPYLEWAKRYRNVEILQYEHVVSIFAKRNGFFCDPQPDYYKELKTVGDWENWVHQDVGIQYAFSGMKGVDGFMKRMRLKMWAKDLWENPKGMVYPLALWTNPEVNKYILNRNLIKPFSYGKMVKNKDSQGFGLNLETALFLYQYYPNDYAKMLKEFPYIEKVIYDFCNSK